MNPTIANEARIAEWLDQLARETDQAKRSAAFRAYLDTLSRLWKYSDGNTILIYLRMPTATYVGGRTTFWEPLGYRVKRDQRGKGIEILAPRKKKIVDEETGEEVVIKAGYLTVHVFDVSQVEPARPDVQPIAAPWVAVAGDYDHLFSVLLGAAQLLRFRVEVRSLPPSYHGRCDHTNKVIALSNADDTGNRVHTLIHELAHAVLHGGPDRVRFDKVQRECHAESVAYCIATALGLPSPNSGTYLSIWEIDRATMRASVGEIQRGVQTIMRDIETATTQSTASAA